MFRGALLNIKFTKETLQIQNENEIPVNLLVYETDYYLTGNELLEVKLP